MMKKAISFLTSLALCLTPLAGTVSNTVAADDTAVIAEKEAKHCEICGDELPDDALPSPLGLYICSDCRGQGMGGTTTGTVTSTTTSTTSTVATTTTTFKGICDEYDFEGYLFLEGWEYSHTQGDELDLGELRFTLNILDSSEENTRGFVNTRFFWSEDHSDQKLSDFYDIDTSKVDMDTPGVYPIYITMKEDKIGYFYLFENDSTSRLGVRESNDYKIKMVEHTQERNVMVMERYTGTTTTTTTTTTTPTTTITVDTNAPFYFNPGYLEFEGINGFLMSFYFNNKDDVEVEFSSSDESVAYFEYEGYSADNPMVTFCGYGETTLTATAKDGTTAKMIIKVSPATTTTTTVAHTETMTTTETTDGVNIPVAPIFHATKPEYDRSVMQVGESREISFYNTETGEKRGIYMLSYDRSLFRVSGEYAEGTVTFTALKSGTAEITAYFKRDEVPDFREKVEISLSVADENGTIATTATTTTSVEDTYLLYDDLNLVQVEDDVVVALDKNGIEFEKNGKYGFYKDSDRYFSGIRPGMRISCDFYYIVQITAVEWVVDTITVSEENCKVKPQALGDVNTDGVLNMADAVLIMQALANPDKYGIGLTAGISLRGEANGDVDQSGDVTNLDALMIQQYLLGIVTKFN